MVDNPEDVDVFTSSKVKLVGEAVMDVQTRVASASMPIDVIQEQIPDYIIITNNKLKEGESNVLQIGKRRKVYLHWLKMWKALGKNTKVRIWQRRYIPIYRECYHKWGAGLFVLLGGIPISFRQDVTSIQM